MTVQVTVDTTSPVPPYEQLRGQLTDLIRLGQLRAGDRLPPVRQLAADLGLAVGTVARAYQELERTGLARSRRGAGTRVSAGAPTDPTELLAAHAAAYVAAARRIGANDAAIRDALLTQIGGGQ
jgi:GntR family transcriptional regulator